MVGKCSYIYPCSVYNLRFHFRDFLALLLINNPRLLQDTYPSDHS